MSDRKLPAHIVAMSDDNLQQLYWSMDIDTDDAMEINDLIAEELSSRRIGIAQALRAMGLDGDN